ncbi:MAG: DNA polymerase I, partial [Anaerohalosphaera sp.]|nr:DNA polymerase I [Anaerohalosphaera sp.]
LYANADEIKGKRGNNLRSSREILDLSKTLVTIDCDSPVDLDVDGFTFADFDKDALAEIFTELGFTRLLGKLQLKAPPAPSPKPTTKKAPATLFDMLAPQSESEDTPDAPAPDTNYHLIDTAEKFDAFLTDLKKQTIFAIDTETTSINAMAAELVGLSFAWKPLHAYYLPVKAPLGDTTLDIAMLRKELAPILADEKIKKIGQNIKYDMLVLANAKLPLAGIYFDTMVASYCLNADRRSHSMDNMARDFLGCETIPISDLIGTGKKQRTFDTVPTDTACTYAAEDADITFRLYEYLSKQLDAKPEIKELFKTVEMPLVSVLTAMERNGVSLDVTLLNNMTTTISNSLVKLTDQILELAGIPFNIDSPKQLAEVLFDHLGLESVKSGKSQRSTDASVLEQLSDQHEIIPLLLEYRQLIKLKNTYVAKLPELINPRTNRLHTSFNQTITATGRLSSSDPNLQNIPIRTELGKKIRGAFIPADKTGCIVSADYSQIELRLLAHFSDDAALKHAFDTDHDIHRFVASQVYDVAPEDVTSDMRAKAKAVNFGIIYGQGPFALARSLSISLAEAKKFIEDYYARYASIRKFMDDAIDTARETGYAETILHRRRPIDGLASNNHNIKSQAQRLTINTIIQGSAADLIKIAMINIQQKIDAENLPVKMTIQVHDELVFELPADQADQHIAWIEKEMTTAIPLKVPLKVDTAIGPSWLTDK